MTTYYHITKASRLPIIRKEGLKVSKPQTFGLQPPGIGPQRAIFLSGSIEESNALLVIAVPPNERHEWTRIAIDLPDTYKIKEDDFGFEYVTRDIPPECVTVHAVQLKDFIVPESLKSIEEEEWGVDEN